MEYAPQKLSAVDVAFSTKVSHLMPPMKEIPDDFHKGRTVWNDLQSIWFFAGLDQRILRTKEGIDRSMALRHLSAIQSSFEPKHEHKEAAVAYLMSLWFEEPTKKEMEEAAKRLRAKARRRPGG